MDDSVEELAIRLWNAKTSEAWADADEEQREYVREEVRRILQTWKQGKTNG